MIVLFFCPPLINILFVVLAAAEYHKSEDGKSKEVKVRPNFQDFRWESTYDGDRCKESAYDLYEKSFDNITEFFQTAVCKLPSMKSLVYSTKNGKAGLFADMLAIKPIVACKGYVYFGAQTPSVFESDIDISPLNLLFDGGAAKFAFGVLKMDTGLVYAAGMRVTLRRHRQVPRGVVVADLPEEKKQEEVTWKVLGILYSHVPGGKRSGFEPILICYNARISRYDYQYKEDKSGTKVKYLKQTHLPDKAIVDYPRWNFSPLSQVKFVTWNMASVLTPDQETMRNIALRGHVKDPEDPKAEEKPESDGSDTNSEETPTEIVPPVPATNRSRVGRGRGSQPTRPRATSPATDQTKTIESLKRSIELAEATNTSLKESNAILKADNTDKAKKIKELEKLEKIEEKAERFKISVLEYFQNKYEDANNKTKPDTLAAFMPSSLRKYFTTGELNA